ncbi:MAG: hypothetical protein IJR99_06075 [Kiritimatiellae bacterium]|nr:hypothetical protein [Kiritimatiellia bacterium]
MNKIGFCIAVSGLFASFACAVTPFPKFSAPRAITQGPHEHFFASYFAINSWSPDNRYVSVLEMDINGRLVREDEAATLCLVDLQDNNRLIPIARTYCWNFQEATMAHWLPWAKDTLIYNDRRDGKFVAVILNWKTKEERIVPHPVSAVSEDGLWAVSINYARLRLTRPDYGYAGEGQNSRENVVWPEDDGLWLVNLQTGEAKLIVTIASGKPLMPEVKSEHGLAYYCHTVFSKDGKRIFWLARSVESFDKEKGKASSWETTSLTCHADGTNVRRCFPDGWAGSHFNWRDDRTMVVTARYKGQLWGHVVFTVDEEEKVHRLAPGLMDWDGHCIWSPDGKFISSDGYWNRMGERTWALIRVEDEAVLPLGTFFVPPQYRETYSRCDLHPRYRPDGKQIGFNSVHEGTRQVYLRDITQ